MTTEDRADAAGQTDSMTAPERIWYNHTPSRGDPQVFSCKYRSGFVQYIRADLAAPKAVNAELMEALEAIENVYVTAPGWAAPIPDSGLMWKMWKIASDARRAALASAASDEREKP